MKTIPTAQTYSIRRMTGFADHETVAKGIKTDLLLWEECKARGITEAMVRSGKVWRLFHGHRRMGISQVKGHI